MWPWLSPFSGDVAIRPKWRKNIHVRQAQQPRLQPFFLNDKDQQVYVHRELPTGPSAIYDRLVVTMRCRRAGGPGRHWLCRLQLGNDGLLLATCTSEHRTAHQPDSLLAYSVSQPLFVAVANLRVRPALRGGVTKAERGQLPWAQQARGAQNSLTKYFMTTTDEFDSLQM